jgi:hypothetical protein
MKYGMLAGASGLVGSFCLNEFLNDPEVSQVEVYGRVKPKTHIKMKFIECDFVNFERCDHLSVDFAVCALGTTMKKAGSVAAFEKVDFEFVVNFAVYAKSRGARTFVVVSALGADEASVVVYNSTKGKMEKALASLSFPSLVVLRPSLLLGSRQESRWIESLAIRVIPLFENFLVGPLRKYRPISAERVAKVACQRALRGMLGKEIIENDMLHSYK